VNTVLRLSAEAADWSEKALSETFEQYSSYFLVGWRDKDMGGFVCGRRVLDEGEILNLAVKPQSRRKGLASKLVLALLQVFTRDGVSEAFLEVRSSNIAAISFYKGLGFRQIGKRRNYYRNPEESALVMRRAIP
jgi:ribosomal-protein-alanine acetyltransferase